ncbi:unnamed protein product [Arctogadus glacialis]
MPGCGRQTVLPGSGARETQKRNERTGTKESTEGGGGGWVRNMPAYNKRQGPVKDVNSKQRQNFNLWAIMRQEKQGCRLESGDNGELWPGAFNQRTSSASDPNLNDISDQSLAGF